MKQSNTKLTTVRIPRELYDIVSEDAHAESIGFNTVLTRILRKYVEWDRMASKFGTITITREGFIEFLALASDEELDKLGSSFAKRYIEGSEFWFQASDYGSLFRLFDLMAKHGGLGVIQVNDSGKEKTIHLRHDLQISGSKFFAAAIRALLQGSDAKFKIEVSQNSITARLPGAKKGRDS